MAIDLRHGPLASAKIVASVRPRPRSRTLALTGIPPDGCQRDMSPPPRRFLTPSRAACVPVESRDRGGPAGTTRLVAQCGRAAELLPSRPGRRVVAGAWRGLHGVVAERPPQARRRRGDDLGDGRRGSVRVAGLGAIHLVDRPRRRWVRGVDVQSSVILWERCMRSRPNAGAKRAGLDDQDVDPERPDSRCQRFRHGLESELGRAVGAEPRRSELGAMPVSDWSGISPDVSGRPELRRQPPAVAALGVGPRAVAGARASSRPRPEPRRAHGRASDGPPPGTPIPAG